MENPTFDYMRPVRSIAIVVALLFASIIANAQVIKRMFVADHFGSCKKATQTTCLLVKDSGEMNWHVFYGNIEGFHYEEGKEYELLVEIHALKNTISDSISHTYVLNRIISENKTQIAATYKLDDQPWFLTKIKSGKKLHEIKASHAFITFNTEEKRVNGNAGCNKFFGTVTVTDTSLTVSNLGATKMMCAKEQMDIEQVFMQELPKVTHYKITNKQLFLYHHQILLLVFTKR